MHFAPTDLSRSNLLLENIGENVFVTGNTVIDALRIVVDKIASDASLASDLDRHLLDAG